MRKARRPGEGGFLGPTAPSLGAAGGGSSFLHSFGAVKFSSVAAVGANSGGKVPQSGPWTLALALVLCWGWKLGGKM